MLAFVPSVNSETPELGQFQNDQCFGMGAMTTERFNRFVRAHCDEKPRSGENILAWGVAK